MSSEWSRVQREYYDSTSESYGESFEQGTPYFDYVLRRYLEAVAPRAGERMLELGCSGGRFTLPLLERGCRVTGVELSASSLAYLERLAADHPRRSDLTLVQDDAGTLERLKEDGFDAVVGAHILHHVEDIPAVLRQAARRLKPGGRAVFLEPNPWNPLWYVQMAVDPRRSWRVEKGLMRCWASSVRQAFLAAGFTDPRLSTFGFFPPAVFNRVPAAERLEGLFERLGPLSRLLTLNLFSARAS